MRHLAIECSGFGGSVSLFSGDVEVISQELPQDRGSVQSLAPAILNIFQNESIEPQSLSFLSVTSGPGSFTGLRVGLTTAKMLAFAWRLPIVGVDTLECLARRAALQHPQSSGLVVPIINAFRKQVFAGAWQFNGDGCLSLRIPSRVVDADTWLHAPWRSLMDDAADLHSPESQPLLVTGPGLRQYTPRACAAELPRWQISPESTWDPRSIEVALIGLEKFHRGETNTAENLSANYVRQSAAEEVRQARPKPTTD